MFKCLFSACVLFIFCGSLFGSIPTENLRKDAAVTESPKKILFVGTSWVIAKYIEEAVSQLGYKPVFLVNGNDFSPQIGEKIQRCEWHSVNIQSYEDLVAFLESDAVDLREVAGITTTSDSKLVTARKLAEKFHVAGPDPAVVLLSDKNEVYRLIPEFSPESVRFFMQEFPKEEIDRMIDRYGSVVIKPARGSGAMGTIFCKEKVAKEKIVEMLLEAEVNDVDSLEWMIQAYISGTLYSLEGYCVDGIPHFFGLTRRSRIATTEMANHFPSDQDTLIQKNQEKIFQGILALISRSGYKNGYFHCEFLVNSEDAYLIDANFGRIGGAGMIEQFAYSFEISPAEIAKHVIDVGLFGGKHMPSFVYKSHPRPSLCLCYGIQEESFVSEIELPENMLSYHTIVTKENVRIPAIGKSDYSWIGIISGDPTQVDKEIKQIKIHTEKGVEPAYFFVD